MCCFTGEGYESSVTVDDEDSKVIIFDNWKQASGRRLPSSARLRLEPYPLPRLSLPLLPKTRFTCLVLTFLSCTWKSVESTLFDSCDWGIICERLSV